MKIKIWIAVGLGAASCSHDRTASSSEPTTPTVTAEVSRPPAIDAGMPSQPIPPEAHALLSATNDLVAMGGTMEHSYVVTALVRLADALAVVSPANDRADRVREIARQLERSHESSLDHADLVRDALAAAVDALDEARLPDVVDPTSIHALRLQEATLAARNAVDALDADRPLLEQYALVRVTIREATRAVYAAIQAPEPAIAVYTSQR